MENIRAKSLGIVPNLPAEYCAWMPGTPKVLVIGNCQGPNIARALHLAAGCSVLGVEVMSYVGKSEELIADVQEADVVFSCLLSDKWGRISTSVLRDELKDRLLTYNSVYTSAVFPDVCYIGSMGQRFSSPMGDYHSQLVVDKFLDGGSWRAAAASLRQGLAAEACRERFEASMQETRRREAAADIKMGDWLEDALRREAVMMTVNHPTSSVFNELAARVAERIGATAAVSAGNRLHNSLIQDVVWPVHDWVGDALGLAYRTPQVFGRSATTMDLDTFCALSYEMYAQQGLTKSNLERLSS
jgi:hypothetical protein